MYKACETCGVSYDPDYGHNCRGPAGSTLYLMERDQWMQRALAAESKLGDAEKRIAEQRETIDQLNEAVDMWMERAGRRAP